MGLVRPISRHKSTLISSFENAQYTDPLLIDLYDLQNAGVDDYRFYEQRIGDEAMMIADIGCGTGVFAMRLANLGHIVTAIEPAPEMLKVARTRHGNGKNQWLQGVAKHLPADIPRTLSRDNFST